MKSELRASCNEAFADFRVRILLGEVVDEHLSEFLSSRIPLGLIFVIPLRLGRILVGILRVEDFRSNAFELRRDLETEVRDLLRRSFVDGTAVDSVDDAARILDGDALAIAVPARVDEVCLRAVCLYALNELMRIFRRRQLEECLAEASGERRSRLRDAALRASQLGREAGEEVYCICSGVRMETGGSTPNASAARKMTLLAAGAALRSLTKPLTVLLMWSIG